MSGNKLNQSLDEILTDRRTTARRGRAVGGARRGVGRRAAAAPVGGIQKTTKATKAAKAGDKVAPPSGPSKAGDGKIIVSNLPMDVTETQIKDYFHTTIGPVKKVVLTYGPNGQSRGIATVMFVRHESAVKAAKDLDGIKVDKRPMKIELLVSAKEVPTPKTASLGDRIAGKPKPATKEKPKSAAVTKTAAKGARGATRGRGRGRNAGRGKPKTADELDAEMQDYFGGDAAPNGDAAMASNGGAVQPVANGAAPIEDEIM